MIKVGIDGAGSQEAGELIRLLINHPDVLLVQVCQPEYAGRDVSDIHHGLIGERKLTFSKKIDFADLDLIFFTSSAEENSFDTASEFIAFNSEEEGSGFAIFVSSPDDLIDAAAPFYLKCKEANEEIDEEETVTINWQNSLVYGVPELNRKPLVRGARRVVVPTGLESAAIVALLPIYKEVEFASSMVFNVKGAPNIVKEYRDRSNAIARRLALTFSSLTGKRVDVALTFEEDANTERGIIVSTDIKADSTTLDHLRNLVDEAYDDHNLSHLSGKELNYHEVEGTDNCLIEINRIDSGKYRINVFADGRMRGAAGEAIHVMNLFAGLFEKTGLHLKASKF